MTLAEFLVTVAGFSTTVFCSYQIGKMRGAELEGSIRVMPKAPTMHWQSLPSGWSKDNGQMIGYAIADGANFYWWVRRGDKTVIEGPARTLELAQYEVESAMHELTRGR